MQVIRGDYGGRKTVIGYLKLCRVIGKRKKAEKISAQRRRLFEALERTAEEIVLMRKSAVESVGEEHGEIFEIYLKILESEALRQQLIERISSGASSEEAISSLISGNTVAAEGEFSFCHIREGLDLLNKVLEDVVCPEISRTDEDMSRGSYIFVSDGEEPGELISLLTGGIGEPVGVICATARELRAAVSRGIPSLLVAPDQLPSDENDGITAILDCVRRRLILDPDLSELEKYSKSGKKNDERLCELEKLASLRAETPSGIRIRLFTEHSPESGGSALSCDGVTGADRGILCLTDKIASDSTEQAQYEIYKRLAESRADVAIRLFELPVGRSASPFTEQSGESSTTLRGAGLFPLFRQVYKTQVKALLRCSAHGGISIILPSVSHRGELAAFRSILCEAKNELRHAGIEFAEPFSLGVELATPAALLSAQLLCEGAELVIIDLDRLASLTAASELSDPIASDRLKASLPAVLKLCSLALDSAAEAQLKFAVRGELAAEETLTDMLIECGFRCFFISPDEILAVKERVLSYRGEMAR